MASNWAFPLSLTLLLRLTFASAKPNLLLVCLDQWRFDWAGFQNSWIRTPNLDKVASEGARFTHAFTPAPLSAAARGALGSGKEYDESPVPDNGMDYDPSMPTYFSQLKAAGYHVMMAGKDHLAMRSCVGVDGSTHAKAYGFDDWKRMSDKRKAFKVGKPTDQWTQNLAEKLAFDQVMKCYGAYGMGDCCDKIKGVESGGFCPRPQPAGEKAVVHPDDWTGKSAEDLLERKPKGTPWFMQVGFPGTEPPFILTEAMHRSVQGRQYPPPQGNSSFGNDFHQVMRRQYAAQIENIDTLIGNLIAKLDAMGERANTVIAITADHGDMLGDHNGYSGSLPWDGSARVPLVFGGPGVKPGSVLTQPVTTLDIVGTFLESAGVKIAKGMTTQSMWSLLTSAGGGRPYVRSGLGSPGFIGEPGNGDHFATRPRPAGSIDWRMVVKEKSEKSTLKLVCCPNGCNAIKYNHPLLPGSKRAQVGLFEISGAHLVQENDLLSQGIGNSDALEMADHLPSAYVDKCKSAIWSKRRV